MVFTISDDEVKVVLVILIPGTSSPTFMPRFEVLFLNITLQRTKCPSGTEQVIVISILMAMYKVPVGVTVTTATKIILIKKKIISIIIIIITIITIIITIIAILITIVVKQKYKHTRSRNVTGSGKMGHLAHKIKI